MKRYNVLIIMTLVILMSFSTIYGQQDKYILSNEEVYYTSYGNILKIPAYEVNGELAICIEDLKYYGYNMKWDTKKRETRFTKQDVYEDNMYTGTNERTIKKNGTICKSDVKIYVDSKLVPTYNTNGYSLIKIKDFNNITKQIRLLKYKPIDKNNPEDLYMVGFSYIGKFGFVTKDFDYVIKAEYLPTSTHSEFTGGDIMSKFPIPVRSSEINNYLEEVNGEKHLRLPNIKGEDHNLTESIISKFNYISKFKDGTARVQIKGKETIPHCPGGGSALDRYEDIKNNKTYDGLYGFIDINGNYIIQPKYTETGFFNDGLCVVKNNKEQYSVINKHSDTVVAFEKFDYISDYNNGTALVKNINKITNEEEYRFIDTNGNYILNQKYQYAEPFKEGVASVRINNKYGVINKQGEYVFNPVFDDSIESYKDLIVFGMDFECKYNDGTSYTKTSHTYMNKDGYYMFTQRPTFGATMNNSVYFWH